MHPSAKFEIHETDDDFEWDLWNDQSPQGTIFTSSLYFKASQVYYRRFYVKKGKEIKAAFCLSESEDGRRCITDDLVIHTGLLFAKYSNENHSGDRRMRFEITEATIEYLTSNYHSVAYSLSPKTEDLRPFLWYNYHEEESKRFVLDLRYTSYLNIEELARCQQPLETELFKKLESRRRRNIREAYRDGAHYETDCSTDKLISFYRQLMENQGEAPEETKIARIKNLLHSLSDAKKGISVLARSPSGKPIYTAFFAWDSKRAYYLFGGGETKSKKKYQGTYLFWEALNFLAKKKNIREIDWEGVNSPQRGWFKLGFGGTLQPYYIAHWNSNK